MKALVIHGHFYQPPRENPWTGEVEPEPNAAPFHDWNERIHSECYAPNAVANNYAHINFNFGPTLLSWLEEYHPETYQHILSADRESVAQRGGHGNAIAQAYGHAILPLCNERDRVTQVVWGIADFRFRFGREPEALWLPETAANDETLALLIEQGLRYVILAPEQAKYVRPVPGIGVASGKTELIGATETSNDQTSGGRVDTTRAYRFEHPDASGRSIAVFFYDGSLARAIAFEKALTSSRGLVELFVRAAQRGDLVNVATDGETYGHHVKFGELCLSHALGVEAKQAEFWITNYSEYLDRNPPEFVVEIDNGPEGEGSSWSCAHGVSRWTRDCGCHTGGEAGWNQAWRDPLRVALNFLRDDAALKFENSGRELLHDPWAARNDYISVLLTHGRGREDFLARHAVRALYEAEQARVFKLLEMQHSALLMFTSCGWFFSDLAGIETIQVLRYAARVLDLQNQLGLKAPRERFLSLLANAKSNQIEKGDGAEIFLRLVEPRTPEPATV
jgi:alpha-amylase/alpha-mannosidase (GH57 family)